MEFRINTENCHLCIKMMLTFVRESMTQNLETLRCLPHRVGVVMVLTLAANMVITALATQLKTKTKKH